MQGLSNEWQTYFLEQQAYIDRLTLFNDMLAAALAFTLVVMALNTILLFYFHHKWSWSRLSAVARNRTSVEIVDETISQPGAVALVRFLNRMIEKTGAVAWKADSSEGIATFGEDIVLISSAIYAQADVGSQIFRSRVIEDVKTGNGIPLRLVKSQDPSTPHRMVAMTGAEFADWVVMHEVPNRVS